MLNPGQTGVIVVNGADRIEFVNNEDHLPVHKEHLIFKNISEARHRDKYIKIKVRYSGEDLAVIQAIATLYNESYS
jgi:hypothetical protein